MNVDLLCGRRRQSAVISSPLSFMLRSINILMNKTCYICLKNF